MFKNPLYRYGGENAKVPAHLHAGKDIFDIMMDNKHITALINAETNESMTYEEMAQRTADIALSLTRMGIRKGDVVGICSEKRFEVLPTILGILCAGAVYCPIDVTYESHPMLHRLNIGKPKIIFCSYTAYGAHKSSFDDYGATEHFVIYGKKKQDEVLSFEEFLTETVVNLKDFTPIPVHGCDDVAFILFSSGTTGLPKGIPHTHSAYLLNSQSVVPDRLRRCIVLNTREWYSSYGLSYALSCLRVGSTLVFLNPQSSESEEEILHVIQKYKTNLLQLVPSDITRFIKSSILDNYDVSSVEWMVSASTPVTRETADAVKKRFPNLKSVLQIYGMSEGGCVCTDSAAPLGPRSGSCGVPSFGMVIKIVDIDSQQPLGVNQRGEICYKGPAVMKGYMENMHPDCKDSEGFFTTGDVGYYDEDGYFFIVNRIKELIKFVDTSIPPAEFEAILETHAAVREAGVVGLPHKEFGEAPVAFIALQPGMTATEHELVDYLNSRVTFKMRLAGGVRFVDQLPRGANSKLDRRELKRMLGINLP